jgi:hypothetical protein
MSTPAIENATVLDLNPIEAITGTEELYVVSGVSDYRATSMQVASYAVEAYAGFTQSGTGAIARTVQSKLQDTVSVFDFMTVAQIANVQTATATLDASSAIQACINYVSTLPRGGTVYFPPGEYLIGETLTVVTPNVRLVGSGIFTSLLVTNTNTQTLLVGTNPITRY